MHNLMNKIFNMRKHISAKIFIYFAVVNISIVCAIIALWYFVNAEAYNKNVINKITDIVNESGRQLDLKINDIKKTHASLLNNVVFSDYIESSAPESPTLQWFAQYENVLTSLRTAVTTHDSTIWGLGVYKTNNESCVYGSISLFPFDEYSITENDKIYFHRSNLYLVRKVSSRDATLAYISTRFKDNLLDDIFNQSIISGYQFLVFDGDDALQYSSGDTSELETNIFATYKSPTNGVTIICRAKSDVLGGSLKEFGLQFVLILVIFTGVSVGLSKVLSRQITKGIHVLSGNMKLARSGQTAGFDSVNSEDEIYELNKTFTELIQRNNELMEDNNRRERQKNILEMQVLMAQVNPHFLCNALYNISQLAAIQKSENISKLSISLINLLQTSISIDNTLIPLAQEIEYVKSYFDIIKYSRSYNMQLDIKNYDDAKNLMVMRMILQPIVENAIIHGFAQDKNTGLISIRVECSDVLLISVTDNGVGMSAEEISSALSREKNESKMRLSGIGLSNTNKRLRLQFGEEYGLFIFSQVGLFTTVQIRLPVIEDGGAKEVL